MRRLCLWIFAAGIIFSVSIPAALSASSGGAGLTWHRLNGNFPNAPNHERIRCVHDSNLWLCRYDKVAEPDLNFSWDSTKGQFAGFDVTRTWSCPAWFPPSICSSITAVVSGTFRYFPAQGGPPVDVREDLVFSGTGKSRRLNVYFVDQFVCPWFPTFAKALKANPFPLPFNGRDWPPQDCSAP
jgi:hypothetical protein